MVRDTHKVHFEVSEISAWWLLQQKIVFLYQVSHTWCVWCSYTHIRLAINIWWPSIMFLWKKCMCGHQAHHGFKKLFIAFPPRPQITLKFWKKLFVFKKMLAKRKVCMPLQWTDSIWKIHDWSFFKMLVHSRKFCRPRKNCV